MPSTSCHATSERPHDGLRVELQPTVGRIELTGDLDRGTSGHLSAACQVLAAAGPPIWVLDVSALEFCDATGIRALVATRRAAVHGGGAMLVVGARPVLRRLLGLAGLGDVLTPIARTVTEAAAEPGSPILPATRAGVSPERTALRDPAAVPGGGTVG